MKHLFELVVLTSSLWVLIDANMIGVKKGLICGEGNLSPNQWFVGCLALWLIAFPLYLATRNDIKIARKMLRL